MLVELYSLVINTGRSLEQVLTDRYPQFLAAADIIQTVFRRYLERKRAAQVMDYDDLLLNWLLLLRQHDDVRRQLGARFRARARRRVPGHQPAPGRHRRRRCSAASAT